MNKDLIRAFKRQVSVVMGQTSSSHFATRVLPIAWDVAHSQGYNPIEFCLAIGFSQELLDHEGFTLKLAMEEGYVP